MHKWVDNFIDYLDLLTETERERESEILDENVSVTTPAAAIGGNGETSMNILFRIDTHARERCREMRWALTHCSICSIDGDTRCSVFHLCARASSEFHG